MRSLPDAILVSTWLHFGTKKLSKSHLGGVLGRLRRVLRRLGGVSERLGGVLGRPGAILEASWAILEASWAVLEASLACPKVRDVQRVSAAPSGAGSAHKGSPPPGVLRQTTSKELS